MAHPIWEDTQTVVRELCRIATASTFLPSARAIRSFVVSPSLDSDASSGVEEKRAKFWLASSIAAPAWT